MQPIHYTALYTPPLPHDRVLAADHAADKISQSRRVVVHCHILEPVWKSSNFVHTLYQLQVLFARRRRGALESMLLAALLAGSKLLSCMTVRIRPHPRDRGVLPLQRLVVRQRGLVAPEILDMSPRPTMRSPAAEEARLSAT